MNKILNKKNSGMLYVIKHFRFHGKKNTGGQRNNCGEWECYSRATIMQVWGNGYNAQLYGYSVYHDNRTGVISTAVEEC